jgi:hypothetical protein
VHGPLIASRAVRDRPRFTGTTARARNLPPPLRRFSAPRPEAHSDALNADDLVGYAKQLELDVERFASDLRKGVGGPRVADDVDGADLSGVNGTPTFFINGRRHYGAYDIDTLSQAVRAAGARAMFAQTRPDPGT